MPAGVTCTDGCGRVVVGCRNGMGGMTLYVARSVGAWCSTEGIAGGVQARTGEMGVSWGKVAITVGCRIACGTHDKVSHAL